MNVNNNERNCGRCVRPPSFLLSPHFHCRFKPTFAFFVSIVAHMASNRETGAPSVEPVVKGAASGARNACPSASPRARSITTKTDRLTRPSLPNHHIEYRTPILATLSRFCPFLVLFSLLRLANRIESTPLRSLPESIDQPTNQEPRTLSLSLSLSLPIEIENRIPILDR